MENIEPIIEFELYMTRHGQTLSNRGDIGSGSPKDREDSTLSEKGLLQAQLLGERFSALALDTVLSSGLVRTLMTAHEVIKRQPEGGAHEIEILPQLTEIGCSGEYEGIGRDEISERFPEARFADGVEPASPLLVYSDSENDSENYARARRVREYIIGRFHSGEKVLITGHGAFNTFLFAVLLGQSEEKFFDPGFCNTGLTKFIFYQQGTGPFGADIRLSYCNDLSHLYSEFPEEGFEC